MLKRNANEALTALTERALLTLCLVAVLGVPSATADPAPKLALPTGDNGAMAVTVDTIRYMPERLPDTMLVSFGFFPAGRLLALSGYTVVRMTRYCLTRLR